MSREFVGSCGKGNVKNVSANVSRIMFLKEDNSLKDLNFFKI